jgi:hypothetical protein
MENENMKSYLPIIIVCIVGVNCNNKSLNLSKSNQDIVEVIKMAINNAIVNRDIDEYDQLIQDNKNIIIRDTLISQRMLPKINGMKYKIMSITQMRQKANKDGEFVYLYFNEIEKDTGNTVVIGIGTSWITPQGSKRVHLSGGYRKYKYKKINGEWKSELIERLISYLPLTGSSTGN